MRVKICGITKPEQGQAIAQMGATALGFICVSASPRYVTPTQIQLIVKEIPAKIDRIGVFANATREEIAQTVAVAELNGVQLHGHETPEFCQKLRQLLPGIELIKAVRVRSPESLSQVDAYTSWVDTLLLDAYHPQQLGGTGKTLDWLSLQEFRPSIPWLLAGGLTPDNILDALSQVMLIPENNLKLGSHSDREPNLEINPSGIDLSSGVERSPGDKDLDKVAKLFEKLRSRHRL